MTQHTDGPHPFEAELAVARMVIEWLQGRWDSALQTLRTLTGELVHRQYVTIATALTAAELEMRTWRGGARPGRAADHNAADRAPQRGQPACVGCRRSANGAGRRRRRAGDAAHRDRGHRHADVPGLLLGRLAELEFEQGDAEAAERAVRQLVEESASHVSPWARTTLHRTVAGHA